MGNFSEKVKEQELLTNPKKRKIGLLHPFIQGLGIKLNYRKVANSGRGYY